MPGVPEDLKHQELLYTLWGAWNWVNHLLSIKDEESAIPFLVINPKKCMHVCTGKDVPKSSLQRYSQ